MNDRMKRKVHRAKLIAARCQSVDWKPPAWVRHLLDKEKREAASRRRA